jgi:hypothetical protein
MTECNLCIGAIDPGGSGAVAFLFTGFPNTIASEDMPTAAADFGGRRFGFWVALGADPTGKRIACRCACGRVQQVALAALQTGQSRSCGCAPLPRKQRLALRNETEARPRRIERDWRPGRCEMVETFHLFWSRFAVDWRPGR